MNLDRVQVGKQFSTELYEKYSIIYEPALALFENDDLKKLRLTDKELQQNLQYNQTMFRELINPTKAKALKFRDIKIKDLSLDKYQIQDMYQTGAHRDLQHPAARSRTASCLKRPRRRVRRL